MTSALTVLILGGHYIELAGLRCTELPQHPLGSKGDRWSDDLEFDVRRYGEGQTDCKLGDTMVETCRNYSNIPNQDKVWLIATSYDKLQAMTNYERLHGLKMFEGFKL